STQTGTGATETYDTANLAHGGLGGHTHLPAGVAATSHLDWTTAMGKQPVVWFRRYLFHTANPTVNTRIWQADIGGSTLCAAIYLMTDGTLLAADSAGATIFQTTTAAPLGALYRVEGYVIGSATAGQVELRLFRSDPEAQIGAYDEIQTSAPTKNTGGS